MFKFKPTNKTYTDPVSATFKPGIPYGRSKSKGDIVLLDEGFIASKVILNSNVLREAILNSKEYLEKALDITIKDNRKTEEKPKIAKDAEIVEAGLAKADIPKSGKSLIMETETLEKPTEIKKGTKK